LVPGRAHNTTLAPTFWYHEPNRQAQHNGSCNKRERFLVHCAVEPAASTLGLLSEPITQSTDTLTGLLTEFAHPLPRTVSHLLGLFSNVANSLSDTLDACGYAVADGPRLLLDT
jgi:hypothetical protein